MNRLDKDPAVIGEEQNVAEQGEHRDLEADNGGPNTEEQTQSPAPEELLAKMQAALEETTQKLAEVSEEKQQLQDQYLRLRADFENYRRRTRQEKAEAGEQAIAAFVLKLLPALDNLQLAVKNQSSSGEAEQSVAAGVRMVLDQLEQVFKDHGIQAIAAVGQEFDPRFHEALMMVETDEVSPGWVVEELRRGYIFDDRVLRPSLVTVAVASEQQAREEEPNDGEQTESL